MKKFGGILLIVFLAAAVLPATSAQAAACSNVSSFGAVTLTVPKLPAVEDRVIWVRLEAPDPQSQILVQVNKDECLTIGGFEQASGQWSWQTHRSNGTITPLVLHRLEGNTLKLIGIHDGVRVDRIVVAGSGCVPQDFGDNCQSVTALREDQQDVPTQLPPPAMEAVRGQVLLSSTPEKFKADLKSVVYIVDGRTVQESTSVASFDTTLVPNGKHTVQIVTTLKDGRIIREETVIEVANAQNTFSPLIRWVKLHASTIYRVIAAVGFALLLLGSFIFLKRRRRSHRERRFHGF